MSDSSLSRDSGGRRPVPQRPLRTFQDGVDWLIALPVLAIAFIAVFLVGVGYEGLVFALSAGGVDGIAIDLLDAVFSVILLVAGLGVSAVAYVYTERLVSGTEPVGTVDELWKTAKGVVGTLPPLVAIFLVYNVAVLVGSLLFILPGLYLAVRLLLAFPACVLEDQRPSESLSTSWEVAHGNLIKIGVLVVLLFFSWFVALLGGLLLFSLGGAVAGLAGRALVTVVAAVSLGAFQMALARVYLEHRRTQKMPATNHPENRPSPADNRTST